MSRLQFVWWGWAYATKWPVVAFIRIDERVPRIYSWRLLAGPLEVRCLSK